MSAEQAKKESIDYNRIVTIQWEHFIELELDAQCEGASGWYGMDGATEICEFWGCDSGNDWRVHLVRELP